MKKLLIFHPAIAPYRIDFFNDLSRNFRTRIVLNTENLKTQSFDQKEIRKKLVFSPFYLRSWFSAGNRDFYRGYIRYLKLDRPDIVLVSEFNLAMWSAVLYRLLSGKKYKIVTICDDSLKIARECSWIRKKSRDLSRHFLDGILLCNPQAEKWYREYCRVPVCVFPIIHRDSVIEGELRASEELAEPLIRELKLEGKKVFLFVGRLAAEKNLDYLVRSFAKASKVHPEMELLLVGDDGDTDGSVRKKIESDIRNHHITNIRLIGRREGRALCAVYLAAQVLVLPSISEAFGAVANEALAAGEYIMISQNAGASCLVTDANGEVININDPVINFENMVHKIEPVTLPWHRRKGKMPISYDEKMENLMDWLEKL